MKPTIIKFSGICVNLKWWSKLTSIQLNQRQRFTGVLKKAVLKKFKNFAEKNLCLNLFLNEVAGLHHETFFKKKSSCTRVLLYAWSNILEHLSCKYVRVTASAKYPLVFHVNLSHKMLPLTLFFAFYFKYFQSKHFSFLKALDN